MSIFGGEDLRSCELNSYILDKHVDFFKALVKACVENHITSYGKRGHVSFIEPSEAAMKAIKDGLAKNTPAVVDEIAKAHIVRWNFKKAAEWVRFSKKNDKEHLCNGNFKRITVQEVKGSNVILDGGAQLVHVKDISPTVSVWKVAGSSSMPVKELEDADRSKEPRYDSVNKKSVKGGGAERKIFDMARRAFTDYIDNPSSFSKYHYITLKTLETSKSELFNVVLAFTANGSPADYLIGLHIVDKLGSQELLDKIFKNQRFPYSARDCSALVQNNWDKCYASEKGELNEHLLTNMAKKLLGGGGCSLIDLHKAVMAMYESIDNNNTVNGMKLYKEEVHKYLKENPGLKAWADYYRFYCDHMFMECRSSADPNNQEAGKISVNECQSLMDALLSRIDVADYKGACLATDNKFINNKVDANDSFIHIISFVRHGAPFVPRDYENVDYEKAKESFRITRGNITQRSKVADYVNQELLSVNGGDEEEKHECYEWLKTLNKGELEKIRDLVNGKHSNESSSNE